MEIPKNTKLKPTKTDNYDKIDKRLSWLWKFSHDVYEFLTPEEIDLKISNLKNELNKFDNNGYEILLDINTRNYLLSSNTGKFNLKLITEICYKNEFYIPKPKTVRGVKYVLIDFQRNYLKELAHNIKYNSEKICNISFEKRGGMDIYMVRFDRSSDSNVFYDLDGRRYIPNEMSKKIGLIRSGDFGSVNEGFIASDEGLKLAIKRLQEFGYEVGFTNIWKR